MPLQALREDGTEVTSLLLSDYEWEQIRLSKAKGIVMPDGSPAVAKVSPNGLRFFARKFMPEVDRTAHPDPESEEHLAAKALIAATAAKAGWSVTTEARGTAPNGKDWIADVLCTRDGSQFAFEVQWSHQTLEDMERRQEVYERSGIRCFWFVRMNGCISDHGRPPLPPTSHGCPAFGLRESQGGIQFVVDFECYQRGQHELSLQDFIEELLSGRLTWQSYTKWAKARIRGHVSHRPPFLRQCRRMYRAYHRTRESLLYDEWRTGRRQADS